jgi:hypothetical protein
MPILSRGARMTTIPPLTVAALERWVLFGARWRLVELAEDRAVVELCTCTGTLVERRETREPAVIEYLRAAPPEDDEP